MKHKYTPQEQEQIMLKTKAMAVLVGGWMRVSIGNVPHVLVSLNQHMIASICYFSSWNKWRIFYPYGPAVRHQTKITCKDEDKVVQWIEKLR